MRLACPPHIPSPHDSTPRAERLAIAIAIEPIRPDRAFMIGDRDLSNRRFGRSFVSGYRTRDFPISDERSHLFLASCADGRTDHTIRRSRTTRPSRSSPTSSASTRRRVRPSAPSTRAKRTARRRAARVVGLDGKRARVRRGVEGINKGHPEHVGGRAPARLDATADVLTFLSAAGHDELARRTLVKIGAGSRLRTAEEVLEHRFIWGVAQRGRPRAGPTPARRNNGLRVDGWRLLGWARGALCASATGFLN